MEQLKVILSRLKNPSVIISIASQILAILTLLNVKVDVDAIAGIVTGICSILVVLGILSNPDTQNKGYTDDMLYCTHCNKTSKHTLINGTMVCNECGCQFTSQQENIPD